MLLRTTVIVTALAASVLTGGAASASETAAPACKTGAATAGVDSTVDPRSNVRWRPALNGGIICTTDRTFEMAIDCWERGDFVNDGHTATDVWYYGAVGWENPFGYVWGGNVNTAQDPPPGLRRC